MTVHLGIELSPTACRIVGIDAGRRGVTRVRSFAVLPPAGPQTEAKLASLRGQPAAAVVWTPSSEHRQVVVSGGSYESMRAEALAALAAAGIQTRGVLADIAPAAARPKRSARQPVVVTLAASAEINAALQPLRDAGIHLRTVTTPAAALGSLARLRRALAVPGTIEAYVALEETITCVALVRDTVLIAARDLPWGYVETRGGSTAVRARDEIAGLLGGGIAEFVAAIGGEPRDIGQVCVTGGMPELRSMTAPLMERLDVEVEPLDSLFAIDAANLPEPADEFRDRGAELRLAWAAAADWPPAINLLRARKRQVSRTLLSRAAVAAGIVVGLAGGWRVTRSAWWQSTAPTVASRPGANPSARGGRGTATTRTPAVAANNPMGGAPPAAAAKPPLATPSRPASPNTSPPAAPAVATETRPPSAQPPTSAPTKPVAASPPVMPPPPPVAAARSAQVTPPPVAAARSAPVTPPPTATTSKPTAPTAPSAAIATARPSPAPSTVNKPPIAPPPPATTAPRAATTPASGASTKPATSPPATSPPALASRSDVPRATATPPSARQAVPAVRAELSPPALQPKTQTPTLQVGASGERATQSAARRDTPTGRADRPPVTRSEPAARPPAAVTSAPPPLMPAPPTRREPAVNAAATRPSSTPPPPLRSEPPAAAVVPGSTAPLPRAVAAAPSSSRQKAVPAELPLAFDATLGTILYSPDRKLAIVDGRIVGVGDEIRGARIVDITPTTVMLRDAQGRLRRLALGASGR